MEKKYKISEIKGYHDGKLVIHKYTRYFVASISEEESKLLFKYQKLGVKVMYIELVFKKMLSNRTRIDPTEVRKYIEENKGDVDLAAHHFNISKKTIWSYLKMLSTSE